MKNTKKSKGSADAGHKTESPPITRPANVKKGKAGMPRNPK